MTAVYRAYSPSLDKGSTVAEDREWAVGVAATRNMHAQVTPLPADWMVQEGHIEWETP